MSLRPFVRSAHVAAVKRYKAILGHSDSVGDMLQSTVDGLSNEFAREKTAEDVIFELFKLPNKEQGAIGKLIAVSPRRCVGGESGALRASGGSTGCFFRLPLEKEGVRGGD